jgi:uncharacterized protein (TIGR00369 family)
MDRSLGDGGMALLGQLGLSFDAYGDGWATAAWVPTDLACNPAGAVHGGVYGVVHDAAMNFASNAALESGDRTATLELKYSMLRSARAGDELSVRGEVVRLSRQVVFLETAIRDGEGEPVSTGTGTFLVRRKEQDS